jgi:hypothetical protein
VRREESCHVCGRPVDENDRFVLVRGRRHEPHCSASCLEDNVRLRWIARARGRRRLFMALSLSAIVVGGASAAWRRFHAPQRHAISYAPTETIAPDPVPVPVVVGPPWPPTDEQWIAVLDGANGIFPLPGPIRRGTRVDDRIFGPDAPKNQPPARCRAEGRCGLDLGGELWGEHVYAALDGVVERVQPDGNQRRGGIYVRLSHFSGMVFTQYFHLAATPRLLRRGSRVKAGDVIGLLGDTGTDGAPRHLHFALSIRPVTYLPEVYWDPTPWMAKWPLRSPTNGTVAGLVPSREPDGASSRFARKR